MDWDGKRVLVTGIARSGIAAARLLVKRRAIVSICDSKSEEKLTEQLAELNGLGVKIYTGAYPRVNRENYDILVASPGIPSDIAPYRQAREADIPVIGELELAYAVKSDGVEILAVTGTNGKTTTVSLLHAIMGEAGRNSAVGGNIGVPLSLVVDEMNEGVIAVEVSSFQLETIRDFRPHICGILNITPDHLDRHKNLEDYTEVKGRILKNQQAEDFAVLNFEDQAIREFSSSCSAKVIFFSTERVLESGISVHNGVICAADGGGIREICPVGDLLLRGKHNLENVLCAVGMALASGVEPAGIARTLRTFAGVRHRMEEVGTINGVLYINDSKATNPDSAIKALQSFTQVLLVAGGRNKGSDFSVLAGYIRKNVKTLVLLGEAKDEINQAVIQAGFSGTLVIVEDLQEAVRVAAAAAEPGDVVLLSPACASWDQFDNYEQRGDLFCELVRQL